MNDCNENIHAFMRYDTRFRYKRHNLQYKEGNKIYPTLMSVSSVAYFGGYIYIAAGNLYGTECYTCSIEDLGQLREIGGLPDNKFLEHFQMAECGGIVYLVGGSSADNFYDHVLRCCNRMTFSPVV